ncbi:MAG TPA: hypothetical protein VNS58_04785 [Puia sp.]|nr:hypothetical protein [Puia sp.]
MKKKLALSVITIILFASCKKNNSSSSYQITASVDGKAKNFNINASASKSTIYGATFISILGFTSPYTGESFSIDIDNSLSLDSIVAGTYTDTTSHFTVSGAHTRDTTTLYEAGTILASDASNTGTALVNHLKLIITSIDNKSIRGTFSGDFYFNGDISAAKESITSGAFYVTF